MPELPEVETTKLALRGLIGCKLESILCRRANLRWDIPQAIHHLHCITLKSIERRAKYMIFSFEETQDQLLVHLGMSGRLLIVESDKAVELHDHFDLIFPHCRVRYTDPRRFGCLLLIQNNQHTLINSLGVEPLSRSFDPAYLWEKTEKSKATIKSLLMNQRVVVGIGNIYVSEVLFLSHILPDRAANSLSFEECQQIVQHSKEVLRNAISCGGTTLKDFQFADGQFGLFQTKIYVYGREGQPCLRCCEPIQKITLMQRSTFFCSCCQS